MNSEEEFYDAETGETDLTEVSYSELYYHLIFLPSSSSCLHQGWSRMIPARLVLKMPWCLTVIRWLTAAPHRRMECGSAGKEQCGSVVCRHVLRVHVHTWPHLYCERFEGIVIHPHTWKQSSHILCCEIEGTSSAESSWRCSRSRLTVLNVKIRKTGFWCSTLCSAKTFFLKISFINVLQESPACWNDLQEQFQCLEYTEEMHRHGESYPLSYKIRKTKNYAKLIFYAAA